MNWETFKNKYTRFEKAVIIVQDYLQLGSYEKVAKKYKGDKYNVASIVAGCKKELQQEYPVLYKEFKNITNKNHAKNGDKRAKMQKQDWKAVKSKYKGIELGRFVMREAVELGGVQGLSVKYNIAANNFSKIITRYREEIAYKYPEEMKVYTEKASRRGPKKIYNKEKLELKKKFEPKYLEILDKKILDIKLLDYVLQFNVENLTSEKIIKMANEKGIKVYSLDQMGKPQIVRV